MTLLEPIGLDILLLGSLFINIGRKVFSCVDCFGTIYSAIEQVGSLIATSNDDNEVPALEQ